MKLKHFAAVLFCLSLLVTFAGLGRANDHNIYYADNYGTIQAAINAAHAVGGGVVYIPRGTYIITNTLTLYNGVSLQGQGSGAPFLETQNTQVSLLKWEGRSGGTLLRTESNWTGFIRDIAFDGSWRAFCVLELNSPQGGYFENIKVRGGRTAEDGYSIAVYMKGSDKNSTPLNYFSHLDIDYTGDIGLEMEGTPEGPVTLNTFLGCRFCGDYIALRILQHADTNTFIGGRVEAGAYGIVLGEAANQGVGANFFFGVPIDGNGTGILAFPNADQGYNYFTNCNLNPSLNAKVRLVGDAIVKFLGCSGIDSN